MRFTKSLSPSTTGAKVRAQRVFSDVAGFIIPVPIIEVARELGCGVYEVPLNIPGYADCSTREVYVNLDDRPCRKRFTVAHELGHILLGHGSERQYAHCQDRQANTFAAELLMPALIAPVVWRRLLDLGLNIATHKIELPPNWKVYAFARRFHVSNTAARIRLKELNLYDPGPGYDSSGLCRVSLHHDNL